MNAPTESLRASLLSLVCVAVVYGYAWPRFPAIHNPNENVRVQMTAALVDDHTYRIDGVRARWGFSNDAACVDRDGRGAPRACNEPTPAPGVERHFYSVKAPLGSLLGVPAYALARSWFGDALTMDEAVVACRIGGTILPCLLLLFLVRRMLARDLADAPFARDLGFLAIAIGSVMLGYALMFVSHTLSGLFAFAAFGILARARGSANVRGVEAAFAGFAATAATALEYPAVFLTAGLCVHALFALKQRTKLLAFIAGALVPVLLVMHFQASAFGSPFRPGHLFVENPGFRVFHEQGFFGANGLHWDAAARLLVDPRLGLLTSTPLLVLAPWGFVALRADATRRLEANVGATLVLVLVLPVVFLSNWDGGWVIGPRYLVTGLPFLAWFAAHGARAVSCSAPTATPGVPLGLLVASAMTATLPSLYYPHLPPEIRAPFADLYLPLLRDGFAPDNVGLRLGLPMAWSMLPLGLFVVALLVSPLRHLPGRRLAALGLALPVAFAAMAPQFAVSDRPPSVEQAIVFVESTWHPRPNPRAP